ncbi:MAG: HAD-IIIA family hydrolase [Methylococcales bacterium]|nr:HAD-IIIA family hydrolase [Methylococcales bacterium]
MKGQFELIIFDWDGTLVDSIDWIVQSLKKAARVQGLVIPEQQAVKNIIGLSIYKATEQLFPGIDQQQQQALISCYSEVFFTKQIVEEDLFTGVKEMLDKLRQKGYKLAVATGKTRSGLDRAMQGTGLTGFFDITRCADETASKPNPEMVDEIVREMAVSREKTVMIGDSAYDLQMAANAGIKAIAVTCGANSMEQLQQYTPLLNLQQTTELLNVL